MRILIKTRPPRIGDRSVENVHFSIALTDKHEICLPTNIRKKQIHLMKSPYYRRSQSGAIPIIVIWTICIIAILGAGHFLPPDWIKEPIPWLIFGIVIGLFVLPNLVSLVRWIKNVYKELKK